MEKFNDKLGRSVVEVTGSMWFAYILSLSVACWVVVEIILELTTTGTYNAEFPILNFILTLIQVLLPTFILVGQAQMANRDKLREDKDRKREEKEKTERDEILQELKRNSENISHIVTHLENHQKMMLMIQEQQTGVINTLTKDILETLKQQVLDTQERPCMLKHVSKEGVMQVLEIISKDEGELHVNDEEQTQILHADDG